MSKDIKKRNARSFKVDYSAIELATPKPGESTAPEVEQVERILKLGNIYCRNGRFREAENAYKDSLRICRTIAGTKFAQATCTMNLGIVYRRTGRFQEAQNAYEDALKVFCSIPGTELEQVACLANMSSCHKEKGQTPQARFCAQMSLALCKSLAPEATMEFSSICDRVLESIAET